MHSIADDKAQFYSRIHGAAKQLLTLYIRVSGSCRMLLLVVELLGMTSHNPVSFYLRCCCTSTHSTRHFSHKTHKRRGCSIFHRGGDEVCLYPGGMGGPERRKSVTFQRQLFWFGDGSLNSETRLAITQIFVLSFVRLSLWSPSIGWILASRCRSSQKHQRKGQKPVSL